MDFVVCLLGVTESVGGVRSSFSLSWLSLGVPDGRMCVRVILARPLLRRGCVGGGRVKSSKRTDRPTSFFVILSSHARGAGGGGGSTCNGDRYSRVLKRLMGVPYFLLLHSSELLIAFRSLGGFVDMIYLTKVS